MREKGAGGSGDRRSVKSMWRGPKESQTSAQLQERFGQVDDEFRRSLPSVLSHWLGASHGTYMQSTSCEMPGWINHKLESRVPGELSTTSDMQMISL